MNAMKTKRLILVSMACAVPVQGAPRNSANYSMPVETADSGGRRTTSANYSNDGSTGMIAGVSTVATPVETVKAGFISQLVEITGLALSATPASVNETATRQLAAWQILDDASYLEVSAASVAWSVLTGPVTGISTSGLATAGVVYQDTSSTVQGVFGGFTGTLNLTVLDLLPDNFGSYAGDGLDDSWQNQYFGLNNPDAEPMRDPDGDGRSNQFEFTAGIVPTDADSRFDLRIEPVPGQPARKRLVFSPRWTDRTYSIVTSGSLEANGWSELTDGLISDSGSERSVTDPNASQSRKFYQVRIVKP